MIKGSLGHWSGMMRYYCLVYKRLNRMNSCPAKSFIRMDCGKSAIQWERGPGQNQGVEKDKTGLNDNKVFANLIWLTG